MSYLVIEDFRLGLDRRKNILMLPPGTVYRLSNGHITRGGEIEKRKALVPKYALPAGTFGMKGAGGKLYVFGSGINPGVPEDITYQRLLHPDGANMTAMVWAEAYLGKVYAIAQYDDGTVLHFYDGNIVEDWIAGVVRPGMIDNNGVAAALAALISESPSYKATATDNVIEITGPNDQNMDISVDATNTGIVDDQTINSVVTQPYIPSGTQVNPIGSISVSAFSSNNGTVSLISGNSGSVDSIKVGGTEILGSSVPFTTSLQNTAALVAERINEFGSGFRAEQVFNYPTQKYGGDGGVLGGGGFLGNGLPTATIQITRPSSSTAGDITCSTTTLQVNIVGYFGTTNLGFSSVKCGAVEILGETVYLSGSAANFAAAVADQINEYASDPKCNAVAQGTRVIIYSTDGAAGTTLTVTRVGNLPYSVALGGAAIQAGGTAQVNEVTIGGTFDPNDKFTITINNEIFGAGRVSGQVSRFVLTHQDRVYAISGTLLFNSGDGNPIGWNSDDIGSFVSDMATETAGAENLTALGIYQGKLAVFSENTTQIWFVDADPSNNAQLQVLRNIGALAPGSVVQFADSDVFFLSNTGVRSLRARDASNSAATSDVGSPIDPLILSAMKTLGLSVARNAKGIIEPEDGRYMLAIGQTVYVFSYFPASKISAWSTYDFGFAVDAFTIVNQRLYVRAGDTIYLSGGDDNLTYDESVLEIKLPFVNARTIATAKHFTGFDAVMDGEFKIYIGTDPAQIEADELVADHSGQTFIGAALPINGESEMVSFRFVHDKAEYARLSGLMIHYDPLEAS